MEYVFGFGVPVAMATSFAGCTMCVKHVKFLQGTEGAGWGSVKAKSSHILHGTSPIVLQPGSPDVSIQIPTNPQEFSLDNDEREEPRSGNVTPVSWNSRSPRTSKAFQPSLDETIHENQTLEIPAGILNEIFCEDLQMKSADSSPIQRRSKNTLKTCKSLNSSPEMQRKVSIKRCISVPDFPNVSKPRLECNIVYSSQNSEASITNIRAFDLLSLQVIKPYVFIRCSFLPRGKEGITEKRQVTGDISFERSLCFDEINDEEIHKSTLLFVLCATSGGERRGMPLVEILVNISQLQCVDSQQTINMPFNTTKRLKKKSTSEMCLYQDLGELFVHLQFQAQANRIKVLVRKSTHLPKARDKLLGNPDHHVVINLVRKGIKVADKETKSQKGYSPIWNEPFLFDLPAHDAKHYSVEFVVMRSRIYTKEGVVGHVTIGPGTSKTGVAHWSEMMTPHGLEVAKWHAIMPKLQY